MMSTDFPIRIVSPIPIAARSPGGTGCSRTRVPLTLPRSSTNIASPTCRRAWLRDASGSSTRIWLVSPRPIDTLPSCGKL